MSAGAKAARKSAWFVLHDSTGAILASGYSTDPSKIGMTPAAGQTLLTTTQRYAPDHFRVDLTKTPPAIVAK